MPTTFNLLGGETRNIRYLDLLLFDVIVPWTRSMFCGLKDLRLSASAGEHEEVTTDLILGMLAGNLDLEVLKLSWANIQVSPTPVAHPVLLPHLRSIALEFFAGNVVTHFLHHIEAPHCRKILLRANSVPTTNEFFNKAIGPLEALIQEMHKKSGGSKLLEFGRSLAWGIYEDLPFNELDTFIFKIPATSTSLVFILRWIERIAEVADPKGLEVDMSIWSGRLLQDPEVGPILGRLRSVTKINSSCSDEDSQNVVHLLSNGLSQSSIPFLPSLKVLHISYEEVDPEEILQVVQN
ncbi:hypothetical protein FRC01_006026 [Tulasnella sp. 417]|nr:hypothetical protein FRC01_006026 [Tulasnella sp. 417]